MNLESTDVNLLNLFGIYKVGDLINIDSTSINRRFGNHIIKRVRQVLGKETELFNKIVWKKIFIFNRTVLRRSNFQGISECIKALIKNLCDKLEKNKKLIRGVKLNFTKPNYL